MIHCCSTIAQVSIPLAAAKGWWGAEVAVGLRFGWGLFSGHELPCHTWPHLQSHSYLYTFTATIKRKKKAELQHIITQNPLLFHSGDELFHFRTPLTTLAMATFALCSISEAVLINCSVLPTRSWARSARFSVSATVFWIFRNRSSWLERVLLMCRRRSIKPWSTSGAASINKEGLYKAAFQYALLDSFAIRL